MTASERQDSSAAGGLNGLRPTRAAGALCALGLGALVALGTSAPPAAADSLFGETTRSRPIAESRGHSRRVGLEHRIKDVARDARRRREEQKLRHRGSRQDLATYRLEERRRDDVRQLSDRLDYRRPLMPSAAWSALTLSEQLERVRDRIELERRIREIDHRVRQDGRSAPVP